MLFLGICAFNYNITSLKKTSTCSLRLSFKTAFANPEEDPPPCEEEKDGLVLTWTPSTGCYSCDLTDDPNMSCCCDDECCPPNC